MAVEENINRIMELQKELEPEKAEYLSRYLSNAPYWVLESIQIVKKNKDTVFIEENAPADYVYILVKGVVRAVDYRIRGVAYDYMWFYDIKTFGAMEIFFDLPRYMTTLMTVTPCIMLIISKKNYERWIWEDKNVMKMELVSTGGYLLEQTRAGRVTMFLQGVDRIMFMFVKKYEQDDPKGTYVVEVSRQELAERSGFSIKTVNRSVKKLEEDGFISKEGRKILISKEQYRKMKEYLDPIVDEA